MRYLWVPWHRYVTKLVQYFLIYIIYMYTYHAYIQWHVKTQDLLLQDIDFVSFMAGWTEYQTGI